MMEIFHEGIYAITTFLVIYQILQVYGTLIFYLPQFIWKKNVSSDCFETT